MRARIPGEYVREWLPAPEQYFAEQALRLFGAGSNGWKTAKCPFHEDRSPSLSVNVSTGGFVCHACGERGGDVLAFHMKRYRLSFVNAAKALGAWQERRTNSRERNEYRA